MYQRIRSLSLIAAVVMVASCASDRSSGVPDTGRRGGSDAGVDVGRPGADSGGRDTGGFEVGPGTGRAHLQFVSSQDLRLPNNDAIEVAVRYVGADGSPIADAAISFSYDELRAGGSRLSALTSRTDEEGIAGVELRSGFVAAEFDVVAAVRDNVEVDPITFEVTVQQKDATDYIIRLFYPSEAVRLQRAEVFLFNEPGACDLIPRDPNDVFGALEQIRVFPLADGEFPDTSFEGRRDDLPLTYAVAVAFKEDTPVAMGCADGLPEELEPGSNTFIDIEITDLFPSIQGEFQVTNEFDLLEFLPGTVQTVVRYIGSFFTSPGATIFEILDDFGLFDTSGVPAGISSLLASAIDGLLFSLLPPEALRVFESGADIYNALQKVKLQGSIIFFEEADETGSLAACNEMILDQIIVNLDTFELPAMDLRDYGYQGAYGTFTGWISIVDSGSVGYQLNIRQFGLELNYGELAVFILESIVFPRVFDDPRVNSMERFVEQFIDCTEIAAEIGWSGFAGLCDTVISVAVEGLRDFMTSQTADTSSFYVLSTPLPDSSPPTGIELLEDGMSWSPCDLGVSVGGGEFKVEELGGTGSDRCVWNARFRTDDADPTGTPVPAAFNGFRLSNRVSGVCGDGR